MARTNPKHRFARAAAMAAFAVLAAAPSNADEGAGRRGKGPSLLTPSTPSLALPMMNAARGRKLFASKGCVVCHTVNGVGGSAGPNLDAVTAVPYANPFDFAARMWRGAPAMIALQEKELGYLIELKGDEIADITAFAHSPMEQRAFSERDIPQRIRNLMKTQGL